MSSNKVPTDIFLNVPDFELTKILDTYSSYTYTTNIGRDGSIYLAGTVEDTSISNSISKYNRDGEKEWTTIFVPSEDNYFNISSITTGLCNSIFITGQTNNESDIFISKISSTGEKQWTHIFGSSSDDDAWAITTGLDGFVYIAGETRGDLDGQTNTSTSNNDAFITKFSSDGEKQWTKLFGSTFEDAAESIIIGSDGSIYIAGDTRSDLEGQLNNGGDDAFISKFSSDGEKRWTRIIGSSEEDDALGIIIGSDGYIYINGTTTGDYDGETQLNLDGQINNFNIDAFISKFSTDGEKQWSRLISSSEIDSVNNALGIKSGFNGSVYIAGNTMGDLDGQTNNDYGDVFISKFSADGEKQWTKLIGTSKSDQMLQITSGLDGSVSILTSTQNELGSNQINIYTSKFLNDDNTFLENIEGGSVVAKISTNDANIEDTHTYSLVSGTGDKDNALFTIEGSNLKINSSPDYETQSSYSIRLKTTDNGGLAYEEAFTFNVNDLIDDGIEVASINNDYTPDPLGFSSINGDAPVTITAYEIGQETTLDYIKDYDGNLHAGDTLAATASSYKYQGLLDVNGDGSFETIFTNKSSRRWVTTEVDSVTGQVDFEDYGEGGTTRVVGIYIDPLVTSGDVVQGSDHDSQRRFQNDLKIDNLIAKTSGDYDYDGIHEVYWKTNDGTAYLRSLMHADGNIRYANYQSESQMSEYLTSYGYESVVSEII